MRTARFAKAGFTAVLLALGYLAPLQTKRGGDRESDLLPKAVVQSRSAFDCKMNGKIWLSWHG